MLLRSLAELLLLALVLAHNATENPSNPLLEPVSLNPEDEIPGLVPRADPSPPPPKPTVIPYGGIAATIGPNESHTYFLNLSQVKINISLTLSECVRFPLSQQPLTLHSGSFLDSTLDGGVLQIQNFTDIEDTIVVSAPKTSNAQAHWSYQLGFDDAASYATYWQGLYWVDSDFANSLFVTDVYNNFSEILSDTPYTKFVNESNLNATTKRFQLFLHNVNETSLPETNSSSSRGDPYASLGEFSVLGKSYCAMQNTALLNQNNADFSTTNRSNNRTDKLYRGQFLFTGLNRSTAYQVQLAIPPEDGVTGGMIFAPVPFHTKESTSCQLIYNMTTCPNTAFSVPGNASVYSVNELTELYDGYVRQYYNNFSQALSQINCDGNREDRFSVFSSCQDCDQAYRDWLCTVAVPRCEDWSNNAPYLRERLPGTSRNDMINDVLRPGKYKEILPCYWLCENLAAYCPLSIGFSCPTGNLLNESYGWQSINGDISCSYPGAFYTPDGAAFHRPAWQLWLLVTGVILVMIC